MKKLTLIIFVMVFISISVSACGSGNGNSTKGGYIVFQSSRPHATHWGGFKKWNVQTKMKGNKLDSVSFVVDVTSLYTEDDFNVPPGAKNLDLVLNFKQNDPKSQTDTGSFLTQHLTGEDYFNIPVWPTATFKSKSITEITKDTYSVTGPLTIMGKLFDTKVTATVGELGGKKFAIANFNVDQTKIPFKEHEFMGEKINPLVQVHVKIPLP